MPRDPLPEAKVDEIVDEVYRRVWGDEAFTPAQQRWVWSMVIQRMTTSVVIDFQAAVLAEAVRKGG